MTQISLGSRMESVDGTLTEGKIAELYGRPSPYWRSVQFLSELPNGSFSFNELHRPERWRDAVSKYLELTGQGGISRAAGQLFRLIEEARREFRDAQERAWDARKILEQTPADYDLRELAAWFKFCKEKQKFLRLYNDAMQFGVVKRVKHNKERLCSDCGTKPLLRRQRKCDVCRRASRRDSNRRAKRRFKRKQLTAGFSRGKTPKNERSALPVRIGSGSN